jgi:isopentenyl-diphosphate delta-isomerase
LEDRLERIVLVDTEDNEIGSAGKLEGHRRGLLHRALSVIVQDAAGRLLLQK